MTESQTWVAIGVFAVISVAFLVIAVVDFVLVVRESLRGGPDEARRAGSD